MRRFCLLLHPCFPHTEERPTGLLRYRFHTGALVLLVNTKVEQSEPASIIIIIIIIIINNNNNYYYCYYYYYYYPDFRDGIQFK